MRKFLIGSLISAAMLIVPMTASGIAVMMPQKPSPTRAAVTDALLVGRVIAIEDMDVKVPVTQGSPQMMTYRIAIVEVSEVIRGKNEMKKIRVGFMPNANPGLGGPGVKPGGAPQPNVRPLPPPPPGPGGGVFGPPQLKVGNDGLFFLQKHATADFFVINNRFDFVAREDKTNYETDVKDAKRAAKLLDNPMDGLKSKEANDRYFTAALMITMYRTPRSFPNKQEPISVEESKLILQALAENENWKQPVFKGGPRAFDPMAPLQMFGMLGVTQQDGFMPPTKIMSPDDYPNACRQFCQKNAGTYQIKRFVSGK
jgi:hypothetical protein